MGDTGKYTVQKSGSKYHVLFDGTVIVKACPTKIEAVATAKAFAARHPKCPVCDDTGMVRVDDGDGSGAGPGYDFFGPPCECSAGQSDTE